MSLFTPCSGWGSSLGVQVMSDFISFTLKQKEKDFWGENFFFNAKHIKEASHLHLWFLHCNLNLPKQKPELHSIYSEADKNKFRLCKIVFLIKYCFTIFTSHFCLLIFVVGAFSTCFLRFEPQKTMFLICKSNTRVLKSDSYHDVSILLCTQY